MKLIFKYFFISLLFLNGQLVHAQSFKIDSLKGKKWELQLPKGKSYTSNLIFKDTTYTTSFSFNGQTHTIEKPYLIQQENVETFYVIFPSEGKGTKTFPVKFSKARVIFHQSSVCDERRFTQLLDFTDY